MLKHKDDKRNFVYLTETSEVAQILPELMSRPYWGYDFETSGLDPFIDRTTLLQIGHKEKQFLIDTRFASLEPIRPFVESKEHRKIAHYAKFEYKMGRGSHQMETEGLRCTYLTERVIKGGSVYRGFSLEQVLKNRLNIDVDKTLQKSFINHKGPFTLDQLIYGADDVIHLEDLFRNQCKEGEEKGLLRTIALESDCLSAFGDLEFDGMYLDVPGWKKIMEDNVIAQGKIREELDAIASRFLDTNLFGQADVNYGSSDQVSYLLNKMGVKVPERDPRTGKDVMKPITHTDAKTLKRVSHYPVVQLIGKWRSYNVLINTFGQPWLNAIHKKTGRIHADFDQLGTETGRPASGAGDVNPLNIPRDNRYRHCFVGGPDEIVESDDYSGCESRILAEISQDQELIGIFQRGEDIHCAVATALYGIQVDKKGPNSKYRTPAKSLNFGIAYGMGPGRLYNELNGQGFPVTFDEARGLFNKYCKKYSVAVDYLRNCGKVALEQGYLANLNGRRRYWNKPDPANREKFPAGYNDPKYQGILAKIEREGGNFMIQSVNADITKQAMIWIRDYKKANKVRSSTMNAVYDEIVSRTHKDDSESFHAVKLGLMKKAAEVWIKSVPMEVDGHAGPCWTK